MSKFNSKNFISGLIIGGILSSGITLFAASEIKESYFNKEIKVQNNGVATDLNVLTVVTNDNPNGSSYLPLRKTAELLGKNIEWNGDTNTANITDKKEGDNVSTTTSDIRQDLIISGATVYKKDGLTISKYNGEEYVSYREILEKYESKGFWFIRNSDNPQNIDLAYSSIVNHPMDSYKPILKNVEISIIGDRTFFKYSYYLNTLLPYYQGSN